MTDNHGIWLYALFVVALLLVIGAIGVRKSR